VPLTTLSTSNATRMRMSRICPARYGEGSGINGLVCGVTRVIPRFDLNVEMLRHLCKIPKQRRA
jgi:hypothetical protein